jgi:hypothetical protein
MTEPTSEWGKELKADIKVLRDELQNDVHQIALKIVSAESIIAGTEKSIGALDRRILESKSDIESRIHELKESADKQWEITDKKIDTVKGDLTGKLDALEFNVKLLPGIKLLIGVFGTVIGLLVAGNAGFTLQNTFALQAIRERLGALDSDVVAAKKASDNVIATAGELRSSATTIDASAKQLVTTTSDVSRVTDGVTKTLGDAQSAVESMDKKIGRKMQDFDAKLGELDKKIGTVENVGGVKNDMLALEKRIETSGNNLNRAVSAFTAYLPPAVRVSQVRVLHEADRIPSQSPKFIFKVPLPEGLSVAFDRELSASLTTAGIDRLGHNLLLIIEPGQESGALRLEVRDAAEKEMGQLLKDGLTVVITYFVRQPIPRAK